MTPTLISSLFAVGEIVGATDLPQPKVNKCLIALVGRKAVGKSMVGVSDGLFSLGSFPSSFFAISLLFFSDDISFELGPVILWAGERGS
jgi:hypothetical protein